MTCAMRPAVAGMPIHHVQELLGHADVKTTGIYLNATATGLHESIRQFDEARQTARKMQPRQRQSIRHLASRRKERSLSLW
jgi:integrase